MRRLACGLVALVVLANVSSVSAGAGGPEIGRYTDTFHHVETYDGKGPACYYGQKVRVVYDATNSWTYVLHQGDVRETLVQNGTASIYDMSGHLLDTRAFHVTERFFDAGTDVAQRRLNDITGNVWYQVSHNWQDDDLEDYEYIWTVPGVYDFRAWNRDGDWTCGWTSGDCQGGCPGEWPPKPPHP